MEIDLKKDQLKIVNELLNASGPLSSKFLANSIGISSKTVRTYMTSMEELLEEYGAVLRKKTGSGYWIDIRDEEKFRLFRNCFLNGDDSVSTNREREHYLIREILSSEQPLLTEDMETLLYLNQTTLKRLLLNAKNILKSFDISVDCGCKKGICIDGKEHDIRLALVYEKRYYHLCKLELDTVESYDKYTFSEDLISRIRTIIIEEQEEFFDLHLSDYSLNCIATLLLIAGKRNDEKKFVEYDQETISKFTNRNCYYIAKIVADRCKEELNLNLMFSDMVMLSIAFAGWRVLLDERIVNQSLLLKSKNTALEVVRHLQRENHFRYIGKDISLINSISLYLASYFVRSQYHLKRSRFVVEDTNHISLMSRKLAMQALVFLQEKYGTAVNVEEIVLLANIIHPYFGRNPQVLSKMKICVISDIDLCVGFGIKERLERNFSSFISECDVMNLYEFKRCDFGKYQMIFTSFPSKEFGFVDETIPIINLDVFFDESKKLIVHEAFFDYPRCDDDIIRSIFKKEQFYFDLDCKSKEECIRLIGSLICGDDRKAYEEYTDDITLCDELYCVSPSNNVVLISGLKPHSEKMAVHVFVLKRPITWGEDGKKTQILIYWDQGMQKENAYYFESEYIPHLMEGIFMDKLVIDEILTDFNFENLVLYMQVLRTKIMTTGSKWC